MNRLELEGVVNEVYRTIVVCLSHKVVNDVSRVVLDLEKKGNIRALQSSVFYFLQHLLGLKSMFESKTKIIAM